jgi:hypothetical protein
VKPDRKEKIPEVEVEGKRLGRHLHHDPRSLNYPITEFLDQTKKITSKHWRRYLGPLDQGQLGSCTGNACAGMIGSVPLHINRAAGGPKIDENLAIELYEKATQIDEFGGEYPPTDTGSSTLGVLKAAQQLGYITSYHWGFGVHDMMLTVAQLGPVIVGVNWYEGMDHPDGNGFLNIQGDIRGGHEFEVLAIEVETQSFIMENSWGKHWGNNGRAKITWHDMDRLLDQDGEVGIGRR